jgi:hypothetical protein
MAPGAIGIRSLRLNWYPFSKKNRKVGALAFFNPATNESLAQQFIKWRSRCPRKLQPFVGKLAAALDVQT